MIRSVFSFATAAVLALGIAGASFAADAGKAKPAAKKAAKTMKCPACGMPLSTKKTKANPKAVKISGKTYYCCAACKMETSTKGATKGGKSAPATKSPS